jgi:hypothetical protein|tara:strand:+ start:1163 stop:1453 length:291 start_codon:yes stop_codon:yes gene_type:complete
VAAVVFVVAVMAVLAELVAVVVVDLQHHILVELAELADYLLVRTALMKMVVTKVDLEQKTLAAVAAAVVRLEMVTLMPEVVAVVLVLSSLHIPLDK